MIKEHDYFLELMSNPSFNPLDFQLAGLNSNNTSILDKSKYANASVIRENPLFLTNGKFDENKFNLAYDEAMSLYNELSRLTLAETPFFRENIFAPETLRGKKDEPEFQIQKVANPLRQQESFINFGVKEDPTKSLREIAESKPTFDYKTGLWMDSPNDAWYDNFLNPKVLAQWDFDADENGNPTSDPSKIVFHKGDKKINPTTGTYYYETLGDRDIYGREVLSAFDTLTRDGSIANTYDFFDSDDLEKSFEGNLSRAVALIAPAFVPGLGEVYIGTRVGLSMLLLLPTIGKIFTGNDNEFLSHLEGINKALTFSSSDKVQGSKEAGIEADPMSMENALKLVSDVFTQLAELRWLFKYGTALFSRVNPKVIGETDEAIAAREAIINSNAEKYGLNFEKLAAKSTLSKEALIEEILTLKAANYKRAEMAFLNNIKNGTDLSKHLSMAYMTGITTADSYGEAKAQGATDVEAAFFALGYTAGEYTLLRSDLGLWILPELKLEKFQMQLAVKNLAKITREVENSGKSSKEVLKSLFKRLFNVGKDMFTSNHSDSVIKSASKMTLSSMLSEGAEETAEEFLLDFSKSIFNVAQSLRGRDAKFDDAWENMAVRYGMSFAGGLIGGGIATGLPGYRAARLAYKTALDPDKNSLAYRLVVSYIANGQKGELEKIIDKNTFADKNLSLNLYETQDGKTEYKPADSYELSLDYYVKQLLYRLLNMIDNILESEGAKITNGELLDGLIRREMRFGALLGSNVLGVYTNDFLNLLVDLTDVAIKIDYLKKKETGLSELAPEEVTDENKRKAPGLTESEKKELKDLEAYQKELRAKLEAYKNGEMAKEFVAEALYEMDTSISSIYSPTDRIRWIEEKTNKNYSDVSLEELKKLNEEWKDASVLRRELIHRGFLVFKKNLNALSDILKKHEESYFTGDKKNVIKELETLFGNTLEQKGTVEEASSWITEESPAWIWREILNSMKGQISSEIYNEYDKAINDAAITYNLFIGIENLPSTIEELKKLSPEDQDKLIEDLREEREGIKTDDILTNLIENRKTEFYAEKGEDLNRVWINFLSNEAVLNYIIDKVKEAKYLTPTTKEYLRNFFNGVELLPAAKEKFNLALNQLDSSPLEELLSNMIITLKSEGFDVSHMSSDLAGLLMDLAKGKNLGNFSYSELIGAQINAALDLINIAHAHIEAAKTEIDGSLGNFFGYNVTVNEVNDYKDKDKLVELKSSTANALLHDLARVYQDLMFYKKIMIENSGAKLTEHVRTELTVNTLYFNNIKRWQINIPDDWKDKAKIANAINNATTIKSIIENNKDSLTLAERTAVFKERLAIEQAIYEFFLTNKDRTDIDLLFKDFNFLSEDITVLNSDTNKEDDSDFMWYMASLAAVDPTAVLKEYKEVIGPPYAPIIALEEAIRRMYAYLINPKMFDQFGDAYISLYKQLLTVQRLRNSDNSTHFDTDLMLMAKRTFLTEGIAGSGKTSATLETLSKMLEKYHPELTKNVWIVSNSVENAKNTAKKLSFKNVTFMSKGTLNNVDLESKETIPSYFERISLNYKQEYNEDGTVKLFEDELVKDSNEINHYKNIQVNDTVLDIPTLVIIDEASSMSQLDLLLSEEFLNKYGTYAIAFGDFDLIGASGSVKDSLGQNTPVYVRLAHSNYMSSWKLGSSMRSNNSYKSTNASLLRNSINLMAKRLSEYKLREEGQITSISEVKYNFSYYESFNDADRGLYGDKIEEDIENAKKSILSLLKNIKQYNLKNNTSEKLNYIYDNPNSELYQYLNSLSLLEEYLDLINPISASASLGQEGLYYVVDLDQSFIRATAAPPEALVAFVKTIYTAISRAKLGTLIFGQYDSDSGIPFLKSIKLNRFLSNNLSEPVIAQFASERKNIISLGLGNATNATPKAIRDNIKVVDAPVAEEEVPNPKEEIVHEKNKDGLIEIENSDEDSLNVLMHSFLCYETGCNVENSKTPTDPKAELRLGRYFDQRLDNLNGLLLIEKRSKGRIKTIRDRRGNPIEVDADGKIIKKADVRTDVIGKSLEVLNLIRNRALYATNVNDLAETILTILGTDCPIKVRYYYKDTVRDFEEESETIDWFDNHPDYLKYYKGKDEWLAAIFNPENPLNEIRQPKDHEIGVMITLEDGTQLMEVPLCLLTSPLTLVLTKGFEVLKKIYEEDANEDVAAFKQILKLKLVANENIPHLKAFALLMDLYTTSENTISYLPENFTLSGGYTINGNKVSSNITGITVSSHEKGAEKVYKHSSDYYYDGLWVDIDEYRKRMPWRKVSEIYTLANSKLSTYSKIDLGSPFILVSDYYGPEVDDEWLLKEYIKQEESEGSQKRIKLLYIVPPMSTLDEYLFNLHQALSKHGTNAPQLVDKDLGNRMTAFRISTFLLNDPEFLNAYNSWIDSKADINKELLKKKLTALQELVSALVDYENNNGRLALYVLLNTPTKDLPNEWKIKLKTDDNWVFPIHNKLTLRNLFLSNLHSMIFGAEGTLTLYKCENGNLEIAEDNPNKEKIEAYRKVMSKHWKGVYYHLGLDSDSNVKISAGKETLDFAKIKSRFNSTNEYRFSKKARINGKADSPQIIMNVLPLLEWIVKGGLGRNPNVIEAEKKSIFKADDENKKIKGYNQRIYMELGKMTTTLSKFEKDFNDLLATVTLPTGFKKANLKEKFKTFTEEEQNKVLADPREFIYLNTDKQVLSIKVKDKWKTFKIKNLKDAIFVPENILFRYNSDPELIYKLNEDGSKPWAPIDVKEFNDLTESIIGPLKSEYKKTFEEESYQEEPSDKEQTKSFIELLKERNINLDLDILLKNLSSLLSPRIKSKLGQSVAQTGEKLIINSDNINTFIGLAIYGPPFIRMAPLDKLSAIENLKIDDSLRKAIQSEIENMDNSCKIKFK